MVKESINLSMVGNVAEKVTAPFLRQPCDLGSTPTFITHIVTYFDKAFCDD